MGHRELTIGLFVRMYEEYQITVKNVLDEKTVGGKIRQRPRKRTFCGERTELKAIAEKVKTHIGL